MKPWPRTLSLGLIVLVATGCAQTKAFHRGERITGRASVVRVLLMPPDIELYELTAGGMLDPRADWTVAARSQVMAALREELTEKKARLVHYEPPVGNPSKDYAHDQLVKLHEAVGGVILTHKYTAGFELPGKGDKFDWGLGRGVNVLREDYNTEFALFIYLRDSYASAGRVAFIIGAAFFGVGIPAGRQLGFASLVDLETGDVVWFNRLDSATGDLRTVEPARNAVKALLEDLPL
jgi:hypothetical protein